MKPQDLAGIYMEIANVTGTEVAVKLHKLFKGQQILFPQRLYGKDFTYTYICEHYNGHNVRDLSQQFDYSDRRVRQIINSHTTNTK